MKIVRLLLMAASMLISSFAMAEDLSLEDADKALLEKVASLPVGMSEAEVRAQFPDLGPSEKTSKHDPIARAFTEVSMAGLKWSLSFEFDEGKLRLSTVQVSALKTPHLKSKDEPAFLPQSKFRAFGKRFAAYFASLHGDTVELYVPNVDCPAGNPYGLRHQWYVGEKAIAVDFSVNSSYMSIRLCFSGRERWKGMHAEAPLEPAPKQLIEEAARDAN
jgi:hypothetical protein